MTADVSGFILPLLTAWSLASGLALGSYAVRNRWPRADTAVAVAALAALNGVVWYALSGH